jgi:hypothetical protein
LRYKIQSLLLLTAMTSISHAALINGTLNIAGDVRVTATEIDFLPPVGGGNGQFQVTNTQTGSFVPLAGTTGTATDLDIAVQPVGTTFPAIDFLTFAANPSLVFHLTFIAPGVYSAPQCAPPPAAGDVCTPPGSPFNLSNTSATSSTASFRVAGYVTDGSSSSPSNFTGTYTTQFDDKSLESVLATLGSAGEVRASYSANFTVTPIPEPGTVSLAALAGLMFAGGSLLRRKLQA